MKNKKISEGLSELASATDFDHEVQMARAELYKIADYAIKLHNLLKNVSEEEGIEAWQQSKITKAADYIGSVFHALDYDKKTQSPVGPPAIVAPATVMPSIAGQLGMSESEVIDYKSLLEKAKSKAQQKFMGMVHAAQKGKKPASKAVADVAKDMPKKAAKDYAATKHKGLPAHVKEADDDDDNVGGGKPIRQAASRAQAAAWSQDADARSEAAIRKYPEFFTNDHLDRVDAIYDIIDRILTPSKIFVTHRFGNGKPFTALSLYNTTWPSTFAPRAVRDREFYDKIAKLGADPEAKPHKNNAPGFIIHVVK
jgi:hypothetical protein